MNKTSDSDNEDNSPSPPSSPSLGSHSKSSSNSKKRLQLSRDQRRVLVYVYSINKKPDKQTQQWLANYLSMSTRRIRVWMQNQRARERFRINFRETRKLNSGLPDVPVSFLKELQYAPPGLYQGPFSMAGAAAANNLHSFNSSPSEGRDSSSDHSSPESPSSPSYLSSCTVFEHQQSQPQPQPQKQPYPNSSLSSLDTASHHLSSLLNLFEKQNKYSTSSGSSSSSSSGRSISRNSDFSFDTNSSKSDSGSRIPFLHRDQEDYLDSNSSASHPSSFLALEKLSELAHRAVEDKERTPHENSLFHFQSSSSSTFPQKIPTDGHIANLAVINGQSYVSTMTTTHSVLFPNAHSAPSLTYSSESRSTVLNSCITPALSTSPNSKKNQSPNSTNGNNDSSSSHSDSGVDYLLLRELILAGETQRLATFFQAGVAADFVDENGLSPMHLAVQSGQLSTVQLLLQHNSSANHRLATDGTIPLHRAIHLNLIEISLALVAHSRVNTRDYQLETPLHLACRKGQEQIVKALLEQGSEVNSRNIRGTTPLHCACALSPRHEWIALSLLRLGANPNLPDEEGRTPLHLAMQFGLVAVVRELLHLGAAIDCMTAGNGNTPLHEIVQKNRSTEEHKELLSTVLDVVGFSAEVKNLRNFEGDTLLHLAARLTELEFVRTLIQTGFLATALNFQHKTPLQVAEEQSNLRVAEFLRTI